MDWMEYKFPIWILNCIAAEGFSVGVFGHLKKGVLNRERQRKQNVEFVIDRV